MEGHVPAHDSPDWLRSRWQQDHPHYHAHANQADDEAQDHQALESVPQASQRPQTPRPISGHASSLRPITQPSPVTRRASRPRRDSLESEQSGREERQRRELEGDEGDLTELAVPDPTDRSYTRRDSYETEERKAREDRKSGQSQDNDAYLTEVAAPPPVDDEDRASGDEEKDAGSESPSFHSRQETEDETAPLSATATRLYTISYLILFSILGTLARLGVEAITRYPQAPFPSVVLWANVAGSLFMGFLAEDRRLFRQEWGANSKQWSFHMSESDSADGQVVEKASANHAKVKKTIPLFIGLATGFCGSFTSFSSFIRDAFLALTNDLASPSTTSPFNTTSPSAPRNGGYSFEATAAILLIQVACSICAYQSGAHLALLTDPFVQTLPFRPIRRILDPLAVFLAFGCWLGAIFLTIFPPANFWRGRATIALVFAPPGCLLRFYASKHLNARILSFPLGTFSVNIFGTAILGMCYDLQHARNIGAAPGGTMGACQILDGVMEGFCGCTTTVSTWVAELTSLRRRHGYVYGLASVATALGLLVVIMGTVGWTSGFGDLVCSV